ncbi:MAG: hypothetical protein Q8M00_02235 [bacterium]|nr:hypothetical protein [bacterium]
MGITDLIAALLLIRGFYDVTISNAAIFFFAAYLIIKALLFIADIGSIMDLGAGILLVLSVFYAVPLPFLFIFAFLVGSKGILTMLAGFH